MFIINTHLLQLLFGCGIHWFVKVFFIGTFSLQHQVKRVGKITSKPEATAVFHVLVGHETHRERHGIAGIGFALVLLVVAQIHRVLQIECIGGPRGLHHTLRYNRIDPTDER